MVCGDLGDVTYELRNLQRQSEFIECVEWCTYLDFLLQFTLEATPDDFTLARLEAIRYRRYRTNVICHREQDQLSVDEIRVGNLVHIVVEVCSRLCGTDEYVIEYSSILIHLELAEPFLSIVSFLLAESKVNQCPVAVLRCRKRDHVLSHVTEVVASVGVLACSKTLNRV